MADEITDPVADQSAEDKQLEADIAALEAEMDKPTASPVEDIDATAEASTSEPEKKTEDPKLDNEGVPEVKSPESKEQDDSADEWPELAENQEAPVPSDWKKARDVFTSEKAKRKELEDRIAVMEKDAAEETAAPAPAKSNTTEQPTPDELSNDDVVSHLVRARNGDYESIEQNEDIEKRAVLALEEMDVTELNAIRAKATAGHYGPNSSEISDIIATRVLPVATAKAQQDLMEQQADATDEQGKADAQHKERLEVYAGEVARYPDLSNEDTALYKFGLKWAEVNIGTVEKPGPLFKDYTSDVNAPKYVIPRMVAEFHAGGGKLSGNGSKQPSGNGSEMDSVSKENELLKQQLESQQQGEGSDPVHTSSSSGNTPAEAAFADVERELESLGAIT